MITQAITTNWAWAGSARLSSHTNGSCDHYPPPSLYQGLGPNLWGPGARFRPAPSLLNSQELLLDTDTPDWSASTTAGGGGAPAHASPLCICIFSFLFHDISNEFWNLFFFFFKHQFKRRIFFFLSESSGIKAGHVTVLHHIDGNSGWLTRNRLAGRPGRQLSGFNRNRRVDAGRLSHGTAENTFVFLDHEYFCLRSS